MGKSHKKGQKHYSGKELLYRRQLEKAKESEKEEKPIKAIMRRANSAQRAIAVAKERMREEQKQGEEPEQDEQQEIEEKRKEAATLSKQNVCKGCQFYEDCGKPDRPMKCMGYCKKEGVNDGTSDV